MGSIIFLILIIAAFIAVSVIGNKVYSYCVKKFGLLGIILSIPIILLLILLIFYGACGLIFKFAG